ncbi:MAG: hypothetical protein IJR87_01715 [Bacteroidaceae bacterium]|nr:hypothetical protein [Bacteroidaceae bacterium]
MMLASMAEREQARTKFKAAIKQEESDACIGYPERELARPKVNYQLSIVNYYQFLCKVINKWED